MGLFCYCCSGKGEELKERRVMGLVGVQENGKGELALSLGNKNKYKRMDFELSDEFDDETSNHYNELVRKKSIGKYVLACATFASLNNVLLGCGFWHDVKTKRIEGPWRVWKVI